LSETQSKWGIHRCNNNDGAQSLSSKEKIMSYLKLGKEEAELPCGGDQNMLEGDLSGCIFSLLFLRT
jgi:hypothetical protein